MKTGIIIASAKYLSGYKIEFTFSDGWVNVFDYENVVMRNHEESFPYRDIKKFRKFKIVSGGTEIAWGKDWDMILPLHTIYAKQKVSFSGRKKLDDKKILLRVFVKESIIVANGGANVSSKKCEKYLTELIK